MIHLINLWNLIKVFGIFAKSLEFLESLESYQNLLVWNLWNFSRISGTSGKPSKSLESQRNIWNLKRISGIVLDSLESNLSKILLEYSKSYWNLRNLIRIFRIFRISCQKRVIRPSAPTLSPHCSQLERVATVNIPAGSALTPTKENFIKFKQIFIVSSNFACFAHSSILMPLFGCSSKTSQIGKELPPGMLPNVPYCRPITK